MPRKRSKKRSKKTEKEKRVSSGIRGLDKLISGGYIPGDTYLITGGTGTGKTLFCCQFLWEGLNNGEKSIYFTLEETPEDILEDVKEFGWDFSKYIKERKFIIEFQDPFELVDVSSLIKSRIEKFGAKRVVIDSTSIFGMIFKDEHELRKRLYELIRMLKETGAVILMTAEVPEGPDGQTRLSRFGIEEFIADGVIVLYYTSLGAETFGNIEVRKMRRTAHKHGIFPTRITKNGVEVGKESVSLIK